MVVRGFCAVLRDAKRIPYKYEIQILLVGDGLPVPKFLFDKLEFGGMITIVCQRRPCKEIPLLGEMSAEQTKGCPFSEKKLASVSETEGFVAKQHNGFCTI